MQVTQYFNADVSILTLQLTCTPNCVALAKNWRARSRGADVHVQTVVGVRVVCTAVSICARRTHLILSSITFFSYQTSKYKKVTKKKSLVASVMSESEAMQLDFLSASTARSMYVLLWHQLYQNIEILTVCHTSNRIVGSVPVN
jgi:hypothetical protein